MNTYEARSTFENHTGAARRLGVEARRLDTSSWSGPLGGEIGGDAWGGFAPGACSYDLPF